MTDGGRIYQAVTSDLKQTVLSRKDDANIDQEKILKCPDLVVSCLDSIFRKQQEFDTNTSGRRLMLHQLFTEKTRCGT